MLTRSVEHTTGGHHTLLILRGERGVAHADIWKYNGEPIGVIGFHSRTPRSEGQELQTCPILGHCYDAACTYAGGFDVAALYRKNNTGPAFAELESWYLSIFAEEPQRTQS